MVKISDNLQDVQSRIAAAARASRRNPEDIRLLAVSKTWPAESVRTAWVAGQRAFGENYVQEGVTKITTLADLLPAGIEWHFIGPLQSNKTRDVAEHFSWVHGIDRLKIAERLSAQRPDHLPPLNVCIQINVSGEASKSGVAPEAARELAHAVSGLPHLRLRGLMAIPEPTNDEALLKSRFASLRHLRETLVSEGLSLDTLSMGMSHDFELAIAEGATLIRVGTAIFGTRTPAAPPPPPSTFPEQS